MNIKGILLACMCLASVSYGSTSGAQSLFDDINRGNRGYDMSNLKTECISAVREFLQEGNWNKIMDVAAGYAILVYIDQADECYRRVKLRVSRGEQVNPEQVLCNVNDLVIIVESIQCATVKSVIWALEEYCADLIRNGGNTTEDYKARRIEEYVLKMFGMDDMREDRGEAIIDRNVLEQWVTKMKEFMQDGRGDEILMDEDFERTLGMMMNYVCERKVGWITQDVQDIGHWRNATCADIVECKRGNTGD